MGVSARGTGKSRHSRVPSTKAPLRSPRGGVLLLGRRGDRRAGDSRSLGLPALLKPLDHSGVVCADGHLGYAQPVGGVIAYEKQISISGVGFDIGCGNMAIRRDTPFNAIADRVGTIIKISTASAHTP